VIELADGGVRLARLGCAVTQSAVSETGEAGMARQDCCGTSAWLMCTAASLLPPNSLSPPVPYLTTQQPSTSQSTPSTMQLFVRNLDGSSASFSALIWSSNWPGRSIADFMGAALLQPLPAQPTLLARSPAASTSIHPPLVSHTVVEPSHPAAPLPTCQYQITPLWISPFVS
jgi:hypothetical protein